MPDFIERNGDWLIINCRNKKDDKVEPEFAAKIDTISFKRLEDGVQVCSGSNSCHLSINDDRWFVGNQEFHGELTNAKMSIDLKSDESVLGFKDTEFIAVNWIMDKLINLLITN